ncbi:MAG TPA: rhodanese-like domain-containing protein [Ignavibacteria bacterium]|nr:rhodanese-like domain-containing protein [Ignavibacteria bacterium]
MFNTIKGILGIEDTDLKQLLIEGGVILDVRNKGEFSGGHINGSINIPLDTLQNNLNILKEKNRAIITCCASGVRSAKAKNLLKVNGYSNVHNGGGWQSLNQKINN